MAVIRQYLCWTKPYNAMLQMWKDNPKENKSMMTQHEALLYLAAQLPEIVAMRDSYLNHAGTRITTPNKDTACWKDSGLPILSTEWQQIAIWVEEKMTDEQWREYIIQLHYFLLGTVWAMSDIQMDLRKTVSATYTTRATAMKEAGIKIV